MRAADVAEILELPLGTAKTRIRRGKQLLAEAIEGLDAPGNVLKSTLSDLDDWAQRLREQLGS